MAKFQELVKAIESDGKHHLVFQNQRRNKLYIPLREGGLELIFSKESGSIRDVIYVEGPNGR